MPPRRTRQIAPAAETVQDEVPAAFTAPVTAAPRKTQARRVQSATANPKVRLPKEKRAVENVNGDLKAEIAGRYFRLAESIGLMPLMEWAAAQDEVDVRDANQLLSFYRILQDVVHPDDWQEFKAFTRKEKCTDAQFVAFQNAAMEAIAARPTAAPETS
jgi:hypothetical protein